jgi:hypothetical protein
MHSIVVKIFVTQAKSSEINEQDILLGDILSQVPEVPKASLWHCFRNSEVHELSSNLSEILG